MRPAVELEAAPNIFLVGANSLLPSNGTSNAACFVAIAGTRSGAGTRKIVVRLFSGRLWRGREENQLEIIFTNLMRGETLAPMCGQLQHGVLLPSSGARGVKLVGVFSLSSLLTSTHQTYCGFDSCLFRA